VTDTARPSSACPACGEALVDASARFCEACGAAVAGSVAPTGGAEGVATAGPTSPVSTRETPGGDGCAHCGAEVGDDGYCLSCGMRTIEPITVEDRGGCAFATHRGRRHPRNEDSGALATTGEGWPILVVSDGVSASPNPHLASAAAVAAAARELDGRPFTGGEDLARAVLAAHRAVCDVPAGGDPQWPDDGSHPACTIVVAVAATDAVHVANVGDARAYLLTAGHAGDRWSATQLSADDSVAALAVEEGVQPAVALTLPGGHAITAWLGADAPEDPEANLATHPARAGDLLLACSDGLWNYAPTDESLADQVDAVVPPATELLGTVAKACEELVAWANGQGGSDNICAALAVVATEPDDPDDPDDEEEAS